MASSKLDNFLSKSHQLWNDWYSAHYDVGTNAIQVWVGLRVQLDDRFHSRRSSTSRERHRSRRAAARAADNPSPRREQDTNEEVIESVIPSSLEDETNKN